MCAWTGFLCGQIGLANMKFDKVAISLFDHTGYALRPWAIAGYECLCFDIKNNQPPEIYGNSRIYFIKADLNDTKAVAKTLIYYEPKFISMFPPCTDLAVSGAAHFESKRSINANFQKQAVDLAVKNLVAINALQIPWMLENPISVLSSMWRKPDHYFDPFEYGGYLPENDLHPNWPNIIEPRDAYPKRTSIWCGNGFVMPTKKPVAVLPGLSKQHKKLGGKSDLTKTIRSATPRGFAQAMFESNS